MAYGNGMSYGEIAAHLGMTEREARDVCYSGLRKLRSQRGALARMRQLAALLQAERDGFTSRH